MNLSTKKLYLLPFFFLAGFTNAQVAQKETGEALIIIARPSDMWLPDKGYLSESVNVVKSKMAYFSYEEPQGKRAEIHNSLLSKYETAPVAELVVAKLSKAGFSIGGSSAVKNKAHLSSSTPINIFDLPEFIEAQNAVYAKSIEKAGNPEKLEGKESTKNLFGNLLSVATFFVVGEKFGYANANSAVIGNSVAFDLGESVQKFGKVLVPRPLPLIDFSNYKQADIYRVTSLKSVGMVIIAYKEPKTLETERAALAEAIYSLTGADTTPEAIVKERENDFATRKKIWADCVARGECSE